MGWITIIFMGLAVRYFMLRIQLRLALCAFFAQFFGAMELTIALIAKPLNDLAALAAGFG